MEEFWEEVIFGLVGLIGGVFVSPAFGLVAAPRGAINWDLPEIVDEAKRRFPSRLRLPRPQKKPQGTGSTDTSLIVWVVGIALTVKLYIDYREPILIFLFGLALLISVLASISLLSMSRKGVVAGGVRLAAVILALFAASCVGIVVVAMLWSPLFATPEYMAQLDSKNGGGVKGFFYVFYQIIGGAAYLVVALSCIMLSLCILSALNLHVKAAGTWLWAFSFRATVASWSIGVFLGSIVFSTVSLLFTSGYAFSTLDKLSTLSSF